MNGIKTLVVLKYSGQKKSSDWSLGKGLHVEWWDLQECGTGCARHPICSADGLCSCSAQPTLFLQDKLANFVCLRNLVPTVCCRLTAVTCHHCHSNDHLET